jgi:hypothetical protein
VFAMVSPTSLWRTDKWVDICRQLFMRIEREDDEFLWNIFSGTKAVCMISALKQETVNGIPSQRFIGTKEVEIAFSSGKSHA